MTVAPNRRIAAQNVVVEYPIYNATSRSLKQTVLRAAAGGSIRGDDRGHVVVRALDNASFEIFDGDRVGIVGHNGAGKTTLLRVLAGVYEPVSGLVEINGRVSALLDLSSGMDNEATGYENIFLRGILMGLTPGQVATRVDEIAQFSGLGDYLAMPMRTYSSGMLMRLAFSVSTCIEPDILLMDEWLSVGDAEFVDKAERRLDALINKASVLVLASHSEDLVHRVCNKVLRMDHGRATLGSIENRN